MSGRRRWAPTAALAALALAHSLAPRSLPARAPLDLGAPPRGIALGLFASDPRYDYGPLLAEIAARGARDVLLVTVWFQSGLSTHDIAPDPARSPSAETLRRAIAQARARGLRVGVMPLVRLRQEGPGVWRGALRPADLGAWFRAYEAFLAQAATLAEEGGAARLVVGSELSSLEGEAERWRALIRRTRSRFSGRLVYSANWDHAQALPFADELDELGVSAYFPLGGGGERPPLSALVAAWRGPLELLARLRARYGKPLLLTEIGYPARAGAADEPWRVDVEAELDLELQARLFDAFRLAVLERGDVLDGFYVWNWFGFGGPSDGGYSPRGKPAAAAVERCLREGAGGP